MFTKSLRSGKIIHGRLTLRKECLINCDPTSCFHTRLMAPCPRRVLNFHFLAGEVINLQERKWYVFAGSLMYIHQSYMMTTKLSHIPIFIMLEQASTQPQEVHRNFHGWECWIPFTRRNVKTYLRGCICCNVNFWNSNDLICPPSYLQISLHSRLSWKHVKTITP